MYESFFLEFLRARWQYIYIYIYMYIYFWKKHFTLRNSREKLSFTPCKFTKLCDTTWNSKAEIQEPQHMSFSWASLETPLPSLEIPCPQPTPPTPILICFKIIICHMSRTADTISITVIVLTLLDQWSKKSDTTLKIVGNFNNNANFS